MAKGDRWSDDPNVEVREMRNAETVLGVIRGRESQAETTGELLEIERLTSSLEGGGGNRTQPVSRKGLRTPAQADTSPAAYPTPTGAHLRNDSARLPRRLRESEHTESPDAAAVRCNAWFGLHDAPWRRRTASTCSCPVG